MLGKIKSWFDKKENNGHEEQKPLFNIVETRNKKFLVVFLTPEKDIFSNGIPKEMIIGEVKKEGNAIIWSSFKANGHLIELYIDYMNHAKSQDSNLQKEAKRVKSGNVFEIDNRAKDPYGKVEPEDITGFFKVKDGEIVKNSFEYNKNHKLFTKDGKPSSILLDKNFIEGVHYHSKVRKYWN